MAHFLTSRTTQIPLFLAPAFVTCASTASNSLRSFASSACRQKKRKGNRDGNKRRGVSAMRSTGFHHPLAVDKLYKELPVPRKEEQRPRDEFPAINPDHGLYGFFNAARDIVLTPDKEEQHGRGWAYSQLLFKSFEDLHALYWECIKEANRAKTRLSQQHRLRLGGYGQDEIKGRLLQVKTTMRNIRKVLRDRQAAYDQAKLTEYQGILLQTMRDAEDRTETELNRRDVLDRGLPLEAQVVDGGAQSQAASAESSARNATTA